MNPDPDPTARVTCQHAFTGVVCPYAHPAAEVTMNSVQDSARVEAGTDPGIRCWRCIDWGDDVQVALAAAREEAAETMYLKKAAQQQRDDLSVLLDAAREEVAEEAAERMRAVTYWKDKWNAAEAERDTATARAAGLIPYTVHLTTCQRSVAWDDPGSRPSCTCGLTARVEDTNPQGQPHSNSAALAAPLEPAGRGGDGYSNPPIFGMTDLPPAAEGD